MTEEPLDLSHLDHPELAHLDIVSDPLEDSTHSVELPHRFKARTYQELAWYALFRDGFKRFAFPWHRRAGKDRNWFNLMACWAEKNPGNYLYAFPTYNQGRKVLWDGIGADGMRFIDNLPETLAKRNQQEMKFTFYSGSIMQIVGTDQIDLLRGTNPQGIVFTEWQHCNPMAWDVMRPILAENGGWASFLWTAAGKNHAFRMEKMARGNPAWFFQKLTVADTKRPDGSPVISDKDIQAERDGGMSEEMIEQEFHLSYEAANPGSYYGRYIELAYKQGRVCFIPIVPELDVFTFWDLGVHDYMSIWCMQNLGKEYRFVHYYQNSGYALAHYWNYLKDWARDNQVRFGGHWAPHDIEVREMVSEHGSERPQSRREKAAKLGLKFHTVPRIDAQSTGIEAVRSILASCWFDERGTDTGVSALQEYATKFDDKKRMFLDAPDHNWASHGAKAFETFAVGWKDRFAHKRERPRPLPRLVVNFDPLRG